MKKTFTLFALLTLLLASQPILAQEPGNNLGKSFATMKSDWPDMRFVEKSEGIYDMYVSIDEGAYYMFFFQNNVLKKEALLLDSQDGFAKEYHDAVRNAFMKNKNYRKVDQDDGITIFYYSYFKISLLYEVLSDGTQRFIMEYNYL